MELSAVYLSAFSDVRLDGRTPWNTGRSSAWNTGRSSVLTGFSYNSKARPGQPGAQESLPSYYLYKLLMILDNSYYE